MTFVAALALAMVVGTGLGVVLSNRRAIQPHIMGIAKLFDLQLEDDAGVAIRNDLASAYAMIGVEPKRVPLRRRFRKRRREEPAHESPLPIAAASEDALAEDAATTKRLNEAALNSIEETPARSTNAAAKHSAPSSGR